MDWEKLIADADWVAIGTAALALATFALVVETRRARVAQERDQVAHSLRLALVELADAVHRWETTPPETGSLVYSTPDVPVELPQTRDLLARATLPSAVLAYLLWSTDAVRTISSWYLAVIFDRVPQVGNPSHEVGGGWGTEEGQDLWWAVLGRLVAAANVVGAECRRRGLIEIDRAFSPLFDIDLRRDPDPGSLYVGTWEGLRAQPRRP